MSLSRKRAALGAILIAITLTPTLPAQSIDNQAAQQEPSDSSVEEAITHGVAAFKSGRFADAVRHFKAAVAFDPSSNQARLYLGVSYSYQVVPNLNTPDNLATANNAINILKQIPESAPEHLAALKQVATLYRNTSRFNQAKETELQVLKLEPTDVESQYAIGVIDWTQAYKNAVRILATAYLTDDGNGNTKLNISACQELSGQNSSLVQDGIDHLTHAIDIKPDFEDAMQYLNLTYRRQADLACGDDTKRTEAIALADQWTQKAAFVRQKKQAHSAPTNEAP
ncbi:tetratricopeptide repeat protein [Edaphobacter aggregans]|uniref:Tetratricopeptide repeat protein n=1 Tax=Edaphobacter aggregans TaxID=570835 RepID=A0A428MJY4_9BACT|nr:tetratricopeptide repeat protein [Edaphobacter aggregans]RSL17281.1 tetratricopeptide repeat protein [Edaphobacter aggregans]